MHKNQKYDWTNKATLLEELQNSSTMSEFLKSNNLTASSGNFNTLKKWIHNHQIDIDQFKFKKTKPIIQKTKSLTDFSNIFCEKSFIKRSTLKNIIKKEALIPYKCGCGIQDIWQGLPITLQLEHKNGINSDNRLENLEFLCPNCHSQTKTYGSKNKHLKLFNLRIESLKNYKEIKFENLDEIANIFEISSASTHDWINIHKQKIEENNILVSLSMSTRPVKLNNIKSLLSLISQSDFSQKSINEIASKYNTTSQSVRKIIKNNDLALYLKLDLSNEDQKRNLSKKLQADRKNFLSSIDRDNPNIENIVSYFNLDYSRTMAWLGKYDKELFQFIKNKQKNHIPISSLEIDSVTSRLDALSLLTNKKQVPSLAQSWNMSTNGAKKWIKNNAPEKFSEIYDDKHLEKNKALTLKLEKMNYIKNLAIEGFNLEDFIKDYGGNKSGAYSILSKYNPVLFEHISKTPDCACGGKTRTAGTQNEKVVYKCKACTKSFTSSIAQPMF